MTDGALVATGHPGHVAPMQILLILIGVWILFGALGAVFHALKFLIGVAIIVSLLVLVFRDKVGGRS
jgi:hypothetical protein